MCGRAAQTAYAVEAAAKSLLGVQSYRLPQESDKAPPKTQAPEGHSNRAPNAGMEENPLSEIDHEDLADVGASSSPRGNFNMSPGMDAWVFWKEGGEFRVGRKVWGLVPHGGTKNHPLPGGMNVHFSNQMYNARSDTLYEKRTFSRLATSGKTCVVALAGFFEWKEVGKGFKQPYYIYRNQDKSTARPEAMERPYLLMTGLWTSVPTGREDDPVLESFAISTTDVCQPLTWLHTRMPVVIWDEKLAMQWLDKPSESVFRKLEEAAHRTPDHYLQWHAVKPQMSSLKYRSEDAISPLPRVKTVTSLFAAAAAKQSEQSFNTNDLKKSPDGKRPRETPSSVDKKRLPSVTTPESSKKKAKTNSALKTPQLNKKGTLHSFFTAKPSPSSK